MSDKMKSFSGTDDDLKVFEGEIEISYNWSDGRDDNAIYINVVDDNERSKGILLNRESATQALYHLNELLGYPLSIAPSAG